ncbi:MAG: hypothetical protein HUU46_01590 [Candidatus Hydrogenedentes bacterium]|nr:hypothetical protein [Candidatus Hydrogenedentota bacterium]
MCEHCGEAVFAREVTEQIRRMVQGEGRPVKTVSMDVFALSCRSGAGCAPVR